MHKMIMTAHKGMIKKNKKGMEPTGNTKNECHTFEARWVDSNRFDGMHPFEPSEHYLF